MEMELMRVDFGDNFDFFGDISICGEVDSCEFFFCVINVFVIFKGIFYENVVVRFFI